MKFNREKSKMFTSLECIDKKKVEKIGKITLTSFGIVLILFGTTLSNNNKLQNDININNNTSIVISDYDRQRWKYLERVHQYKEEFTDTKLLDFYNDGKIIVNYNGNKIESSVKALYLRFGIINNNKFIFLSNVLMGRNVDFFTNQNNAYAEDYSIIEFRNTTIFENLYNEYSNYIIDNTIVLNEEETNELYSMMLSWDGKINDIVPETKAIQNKLIWEGDNGEKTR